jgi:hypothetical protein
VIKVGKFLVVHRLLVIKLGRRSRAQQCPVITPPCASRTRFALITGGGCTAGDSGTR